MSASPINYRDRSLAALALLALTCTALTSCSPLATSLDLAPRGERVVAPGAPVPPGGGRRFIGRPYVMLGRLFVPAKDETYDRIGTGAWMAPEFHGRRTANGEIHDGTALVAAHPTLPLPSYVMVRNLETGRSLVVRINDRGPFNDDRLIDVSEQVAELLGFRRSGLARLRVSYLRPAPLDGNQSYELHYLAMQPFVRCARPEPRTATECRALPRPAWR
ncbi:MAG: septal ring lytic transglycosylase RlpA family protein [Hyphomicrobiaceae bacterium]